MNLQKNHNFISILRVTRCKFVSSQYADSLTPKNILSALKPVVDWKSLGIQLGIEDTTLQEIGVNNRDQVGDCKLAMVSFWLRSDKTCSWMKLIDALKSVGLLALAEGIRAQYCPLYLGMCHN